MMAPRVKAPADVKRLSRELSGVVLQLKQIQSAVVVAAAALRQQNSELDEDIANVLQQSIGDRLYDQVEKLEELQKSLVGFDTY